MIELMVTIAVVAILASVALPSYQSYVARSRVPAGLEALSSYALRMEQTFQDSGSFGAGGCALPAPTLTNFDFACTLGAGGQGYSAAVTGKGTLSGYGYSIDNTGTRRTVAHPRGVPAAACWSTKGGTCDE